MITKPDFNLKEFNTLGINAKAKYCTQIENEEDLNILFKEGKFKEKTLIVGEASNILFKSDFDGIVLMINTKGIEIFSETKNEIILEVKSGENWNNLVDYTVKNKYWGIENLSMIPGNVGAAPIQNIGAYGTELKDVFVSLDAFDTQTGQITTFNKEECKFDYRDSIFKSEHKGRYIVLSIKIKLSKTPKPNISYKALKDYFRENAEKPLSIENIQEAVNKVRSSKLPDPKEIKNSGSFFKNPIIDNAKARELKRKYPDIPLYNVGNNSTKVAAGWLIEKAGWKGKRFGDAGVHKNQALVLVNYGNASGEEILLLSQKIATDIYEKFGIKLEREVRVI